ncbi:unnamed protein product, partial [Angiostrongylus costaricensis]|uniref:G_PROTEIN_RECEP_F1_2 domain-containing protein n=1 Tax=Angiostrongylus costaricensis TaxID=334426 RepID=A0A0R3PXC5_ANGCS
GRRSRRNVSHRPTTSTTTTTKTYPLIPYTPNYYRIAALSVKCILSSFVLILSATIRRDFLKHFTLFIMIPIVLDCGFDIYTEIKASITSYEKATKFKNRSRRTTVNCDLFNSLVGCWEDAVVDNIGEEFNRRSSATKSFALVCYILSDILFWSTLFTSVAAFYYAHTAIARSEEIKLKWFFFTSFVHFLLFLFLQSFILFFRRRDDYTKSSPYDQVRDGKWRLFSFILFQIVVHILTIPYLSISLAQDFLVVLDFPSQCVQALPLHQAADMFVVHITTFVVRPFLILITILFLIAPYRKTFLLLFCPCCPYNS